jgi:lysophospholipase L1-like esterase
MWRRLRVIAVHFFFVCISISVTVLVCEVLLHVFNYQNQSYIVQLNIPFEEREHPHHPARIYTHKYNPNNYLSEASASKLQFRPDFIPNSQRGKETFVILALGDSFTQGHSVRDEEAYPAVLEQTLKNSGHNVNVINAGVPGYGIDQEYLYAKEIMQVVKPNLIIFNLNENDIFDSNGNCLFRKEKSGKFTQVPGYTSDIFLQSAILRRVPKQLHQAKVVNFVITSLFGRRENFLCSMKENEELEQVMLEKMYSLISKLKQDAGNGTEVMVTLVPLQIYFSSAPNDNTGALHRLFVLRERFAALNVFDTNRAIAMEYAPMQLVIQGERDIPTPLFRGGEVKDISQLFFLEDARDPGPPYGLKHLNPEGNKVFAETVADEVLSRYNVPLTSPTPQQ